MLKSTTRPLSEAYQLALLDLDGVVYRGKNPVEHAAESIRKAEGLGMTVEYTTNNSSRFQRVVAEQLRGFGLDVEPRQVITSSVVAARMVAQSDRTDVAALSSRFCGEEYGLNLLQTNVQDQDNNYTRFICISKNPEIYPGADRTSLMMTLPHKPGSLYNVLSKFYSLGINLRKLESRPLPDREFEFMFYFDLECSVYAPEMERLFRDLEEESEQFRYLGTYNEVIC